MLDKEAVLKNKWDHLSDEITEGYSHLKIFSLTQINSKILNLMEKLLVTTDFSTNSKAGIRFALQLQSQSNCSLVFYHAISVSKPTSWSDKSTNPFRPKNR